MPFLGLGLGLPRGGAVQAFSPSALFASGAPGVWYDPSDLTTLFQDSAGTTPVTAVEQPVGLVLDKSRGLATSAELLTNPGPFSATTGWTGSANAVLSASSSRLVCTYASTDTFYQAVTVEAGKWYFAVASMKRDSGGGTAYMNFRNGTTLAAGVVGNWTATGTTSASDVRMGASYYAATSGTIYLHFPCSTSGSTVVSLASISVRELPGSHAYQTTDINRPVLSARYNLLTRTEEFDNAAWVKQTGVTVTANQAVAPDGNQTADLVTGGDGTTGILHSGVTVVTGVSYTISVWLRAVTGTATVVLSEGSGGFGTSTTPCNLTTTWQRFTLTGTTTLNFSNPFIDNIPAAGLYIWGADLRVTNDGVGLPNYQRVTSSTDYDTTGFPTYLRFDGTDDSLATASIDFSGTAQMSVFSGVRKLNSNLAFVVSTSNNPETNNGTFRIVTDASGYEYLGGSRGTVFAQALVDSATYASPVTNVLGMLTSIPAPSVLFRANGAQIANDTANQGTGNYGNHALHMGVRGDGFYYFQGRLYSLIILGRTATASEITATEAWVNGKTAAYA